MDELAGTTGVRLVRGFDATAIRAALDDPAVRGCVIALHTGADAAGPGLGAALRSMERAGKPVAAVLRGRIADASLAVALACHRRFATAQTVLAGAHGPPVAGISQRMLRLAGFPATLAVLMEGRAMDAVAAERAGLIDEIGAETLLEDATAWVAGARDPVQPWDRPGFVMPGPDLDGNGLDGDAAAGFAQAAAAIRGRIGSRDPAKTALLKVLRDGYALPFDAALLAEQAMTDKAAP